MILRGVIEPQFPCFVSCMGIKPSLQLRFIAHLVRLRNMKMTAKHIIFTGNVQGVGFRFTAHRIANRHDLAGFVRNVPNGTVEMLVQGQPEGIDNCIKDLEDSFAGYIRKTKIEEVPSDPKYTSFKITF